MPKTKRKKKTKKKVIDNTKAGAATPVVPVPAAPAGVMEFRLPWKVDMMPYAPHRLDVHLTARQRIGWRSVTNSLMGKSMCDSPGRCVNSVADVARWLGDQFADAIEDELDHPVVDLIAQRPSF